MSQEITSNDGRAPADRLPANRYILFVALALAGALADLVTKSVIFANFYPESQHDPHWWIEGVFGIETSTNGGALFGMFQGGSFWLAMLSIAALLGIAVWLFVYKTARSLFLTITLALVTGGIIGNLYDRMGFGHVAEHGPEIQYHVRDWLHFRLSGVPMFDPWPNFNIADSLLVCGAAMLFLYAIFGAPTASSEKSPVDVPGQSDS